MYSFISLSLIEEMFRSRSVKSEGYKVGSIADLFLAVELCKKAPDFETSNVDTILNEFKSIELETGHILFPVLEESNLLANGFISDQFGVQIDEEYLNRKIEPHVSVGAMCLRPSEAAYWDVEVFEEFLIYYGLS